MKNGSKQSRQSAFFIAEKINPGTHREYAFSEIAKHEAQQGDIEKALVAACKMTEHTSDTFEYIADILVEQGDVQQAMHIMEKHCTSSFHYYPGKVALKLAQQGNVVQAIDMAGSIQTDRYPKHRDAAFAAIAVIVARGGMIGEATRIAEQYVNEKGLQGITKAAINKIVKHTDIDNELKQVIERAAAPYSFYGLLNQDDLSVHCLDLLFKSIRKFGLGLAFT